MGRGVIDHHPYPGSVQVLLATAMSTHEAQVGAEVQFLALPVGPTGTGPWVDWLDGCGGLVGGWVGGGWLAAWWLVGCGWVWGWWFTPGVSQKR